MVDRRIGRREFLSYGAKAGGGALTVMAAGAVLRPRAAPALVHSGGGQVTHGVQSGDPSTHSAVVWARADRRARMIVEWSTNESFRGARTVRGPIASPASDFTAKHVLRGLPAGSDVFYRVRFADPYDDRAAGDPVAGHLRTAPLSAETVSFLWSGDTAGQGWGSNPDIGGMPIYTAMGRMHADFFVHSGDNIYADNPIASTQALRSGGVWRNRTTPEKSKVAETLDEFRGNWRYNLLDDAYRGFYAGTTAVVQWDDHETHNNWYPHQVLTDPRYTEKRLDVLAARSAQAFHEYAPIDPRFDEDERVYRSVPYGPLLEVFVLDMRTYRGPNSTDDQPAPGPDTAFMGGRQLEWLKRGLASSRATWKVVAADMSLGLVVPDGAAIEAIAQGRPELLGREFEIADLLSFLKARKVGNVVWLTADVHYTAAHRYDPDHAVFDDFDPFWEFVSGPLHAGTFGPDALDPTFGPSVVFQKAADYPNQPPSDGNQFFGHVTIDGSSRVMTVELRDLAGAVLWTTDLEPR